MPHLINKIDETDSESKKTILSKCHILLEAYQSGKLGVIRMPEDSSPVFEKNEARLCYYTLPMSLNYQRNSYALWESALKTYDDPATRRVFDVQISANLDREQLRAFLTHYKVALQPNKHIATWHEISKTISQNWGSLELMLESSNYDFLKLRNIIQQQFKKGFPYLSGPKIFNYWSFIIQEYGKVKLKNSEFIEIAPDTHVTKCSVLLGVISQVEADSFSREKISERWRSLLQGSGINPIDMHSPLWFWSRNNFQFQFDNN